MVAKNRDAFNPVYAAMIETLDDAVGRLMAKVESLGLTDRTIFLFTSDNGGLHVLEYPGTPATHNTPFRAGKGFLYEGGLREPLIVRWPGVVAAGSKCETPVVLTDLFPTLLEAAGIDVAKTVGPVDGVSIAKLLRGESLPPRTLYWHFPNYTNQGGRPAGAIREGDWKLVENFEDDSVELFNLALDPGEKKNVAATEPARTADLRDKLHAWRGEVGARMPVPNPDFDAKLNRRLYIDQDPSQLGGEVHGRRYGTGMEGVARGDERGGQRTQTVGHARDRRYSLACEGCARSRSHVALRATAQQERARLLDKPRRLGRLGLRRQNGRHCTKSKSSKAVAKAAVARKSRSKSTIARLTFTVQDTGHFQSMILRTIGEVKLAAGKHSLAVKPRTKPGVAVMDLRRVVLRPTPSPR